MPGSAAFPPEPLVEYPGQHLALTGVLDARAVATLIAARTVPPCTTETDRSPSVVPGRATRCTGASSSTNVSNVPASPVITAAGGSGLGAVPS